MLRDMSLVSVHPTRLDSLTSLRFFAALVVVVHHVTRNFAQIPVITPLFDIGGVGVSFFFVLSGFVLAWSNKPVESDRRFYRHRFARVYPLHIATLVFAGVVLFVQDAPPGFSVIVASFLLLQAWVPAGAFLAGVNGPSWSLSCEAFFYALFPRINRAIQSKPTRSIVTLLFVVLVVAVAVTGVVRAFGGPAATFFLYMNPAYRIWEFLIGIGLALLLKRGVAIRISVPLAATLAIAAFIGAAGMNYGISNNLGVLARLPFDSFPPDIASLVLTPLFGLLIVAGAQSDLRGTGRSFLRAPALIRLGTWSFALYLVHLTIVTAATPFVPQSLPFGVAVALALVTIAGSIGLAAAAYRFVERPLERLLRKGRTRVAVSTQPTV